MLLSEIKNKKIGIWGLGKEGESTRNSLLNEDIVLIDRSFDNENIETLKKCEVIIKSPGISKYLSLFLEAKKEGIIFTTNTNLFLAECRNLENKPCVIGVTGTKGKSTTSSLAFHGLKKLGKKTVFGGNIGKPLLDLLPEVKKGADFVVCEMSSYQCAELSEAIDYSIILNLYKEHIDWHLSHDQYFDDKLNIINYSSFFPIINFDNEELTRRLKGKNVDYFNKEGEIFYKDEAYFDGNQQLLKKEDVNIIGDHNSINFLAVLTLFKKLNIDIKKLQGVFNDFKPLFHRLETVAIKDGVTYINDSISTTPETTIAGLKAFLPKKIIVLVGGYDRKQDYSEFIDFIKDKQDKITVICMYKTGERLYHNIKDLKSFYANDLKEACDKASSLVKEHDIVLLSPASPSYGDFKNFEARGNEFKRFAGC